jgi:Fe-S cluster assembly scaffold protein SufB
MSNNVRVYSNFENVNFWCTPSNLDTVEDFTFIFIQTEGKCNANININPNADSKSKVHVYIYAEGNAEVDCVCTLSVDKHVSGVKTDIQFRSWPFDRSKIKARPEMFIANSNIIATHGNALGTLKPEDKYYLASRGVSDYKELIKQSLLNA